MLIDNLVKRFVERFERGPAVVVKAPGRINLLGAHVDYNEGWVLPGAIDKAIYVAAGPRDDRQLDIVSLDFGEEFHSHLDLLKSTNSITPAGSKMPIWVKYPSGAAGALMDSGYRLDGMNAIFTGDIPIGAGVSSSAAVEIAFIMSFEFLSGLNISPLERAKLGQKVENQYLGLSSGIMDQFASVHGQTDRLIYLDCRSLEYELVTVPKRKAVVVADSGVRRELVNSEYNLRQRQCQEALGVLKEHLPGIRSLRDVTQDDFIRLADYLPKILKMRVQHVIEECARVHEGVRALTAGDLDRFGDAICRSHISSRDLYEVSIEELDVMAEAAWSAEGCYGARLTGAGFGGCVIALVDEERAEHVSTAIVEAFQERFKRTPPVFVTKISEGASWIVPSDSAT